MKKRKLYTLEYLYVISGAGPGHSAVDVIAPSGAVIARCTSDRAAMKIRAALNKTVKEKKA